MIEFVAYFSTAQDQVGYIIQNGYGQAESELSGGPALPLGTYRVDNGVLVLIQAEAMHASQGVLTVDATIFESGEPSA